MFFCLWESVVMKKNIFKTIIPRIVDHPQNAAMTKQGYLPLFSGSPDARVVIVGQAPGLRAQQSMTPWDDASGERLRAWLGISDHDFYDDTKVALLPMDFYFPGKGKRGEDLPPRKGFAETWHPPLLAALKHAPLFLLIGRHAQLHYLDTPYPTLTQTVREYKTFLQQGFFPLPHPSPRNNIWLKKNPWFEQDVLPALQTYVHKGISPHLSSRAKPRDLLLRK